MSVGAIQAALNHSRSTSAARLLLLVLADASSPDGISWYGEDTLAQRANTSKRSIRRNFLRLIELGEIERITLRREQSGKRVAGVRITLPDLHQIDHQRLAALGLSVDLRHGHDLPANTQEVAAEEGHNRPDGDGSPSISNRQRNPHPNLPAPPRREHDDEEVLEGEVIDVWDHAYTALAEVTNSNRTEAGAVAHALKTILRCHKIEHNGDENGVVEEIHKRARLYQKAWPTMALTSSALAKHWDRIPTFKAVDNMTAEDMRRAPDILRSAHNQDT